MKAENHTINSNEPNTKPEDNAAAKEQPLNREKPQGKKVKKEKKKASAFQAILKQAGLAVLFLVIGMLGVLLALYLPTTKKLQTAQSELDRLVPIETQYEALLQSSETTQAKALAYKLMSNTNRLMQAVEDNNTDRISQYVTYIEEDLSQLEISDLPDLPSNLSAQFSKISASISSSTPAMTADDLQDFYNDLLLLADNLE